MPPPKRAPKIKATAIYQHPEVDSPMRPEIGTQAQFKKKRPPQTYRYDSSLSLRLEWDSQNPARITVWDHLAGAVGAPFPAIEHGPVAVKVIDQRGNELLMVKSVKEDK